MEGVLEPYYLLIFIKTQIDIVLHERLIIVPIAIWPFNMFSGYVFTFPEIIFIRYFSKLCHFLFLLLKAMFLKC